MSITSYPLHARTVTEELRLTRPYLPNEDSGRELQSFMCSMGQNPATMIGPDDNVRLLSNAPYDEDTAWVSWCTMDEEQSCPEISVVVCINQKTRTVSVYAYTDDEEPLSVTPF